MIARLWHEYWSSVAGNIQAMPLEAVITVAATLILRRWIARAWHWLVGEHLDMADVRRDAAAARKIMADLHEELTGKRHELHPAGGEKGRE